MLGPVFAILLLIALIIGAYKSLKSKAPRIMQKTCNNGNTHYEVQKYDTIHGWQWYRNAYKLSEAIEISNDLRGEMIKKSKVIKTNQPEHKEQ